LGIGCLLIIIAEEFKQGRSLFLHATVKILGLIFGLVAVLFPRFFAQTVFNKPDTLIYNSVEYFILELTPIAGGLAVGFFTLSACYTFSLGMLYSSLYKE
jgi:hypothetical protein